MQKSLLLVAHGSRRTQSNEEIIQLTAKVAELADSRFDLVDCAFLELADPSITQGIDALVKQGAKSILVVPYFLARGTHVASDVPEQVEKARFNHPDVELIISDYLGASNAIPELIVNLAVEATDQTV